MADFDKEMDIEKEEFAEQSEWSELPSLPLERIYYFLSREDQVNMSLVCRKWSEGYGTPSIWKTFKFYVTNSQLALDTEIKFVQKYSNMFQHLEILCKRNSIQFVDDSWRHLKVFLDIMASNSQLQSVKFNNLGTYLRQLDTPIYNDIFKAIIDLLQSQRHLKRVEFHDCYFRLQEAVDLLKSATENSSESLTHLVIRGFVHDASLERERDIILAESLPTLVSERFPKLQVLETDYSTVFDNMFPRQPGSKIQLRGLSKVILHCFGLFQTNFRGLTSAFWRSWKQTCPDLQVELYFTPGFHPRREIQFYVLPDIPITLFDFTLDRYQTSEIIEIDFVLNHLLACRINCHLISLNLLWMMPIQDLATAFIPFLQVCPKLKSFHFFTLNPVNSLDILMQSLVENRPESLEEALISISNVRTRDSLQRLLTIADEYVPVLQAMGLNAILITDNNW